MVETTTYGMHQSDLILRSSLLEMIEDLRQNPWLIDFCFASLRKDERLRKLYAQEIEQVKKWFMDTDFPVVVCPRTDEPQLPCVTIQIAASNEVDGETTLGDVHYEPFEDTDSTPDWPDLCDPFTPLSYTPATGEIVLPDSVAAQLVVVAGMQLIDTNGKAIPIVEVDDGVTIFVAPNTVLDLRASTIRGVYPSYQVRLESSQFRETYLIGVHVNNEPVYATYLHSLIQFQLLRRKEDLLEGRGVERTSVQTADLRTLQNFELQWGFEKYITMVGTVRNYWPKTIAQKIETTSFTPTFTQATPPTVQSVEFEFDDEGFEDVT